MCGVVDVSATAAATAFVCPISLKIDNPFFFNYFHKMIEISLYRRDLQPHKGVKFQSHCQIVTFTMSILRAPFNIFNNLNTKPKSQYTTDSLIQKRRES